MTITKDKTEPWLALYEKMEHGAFAGEPEWLTHLRREGIGRFMVAGFPTLRDEEWKYTSVAPIVETEFAPGPYDPDGLNAERIQELTFDDSGCIRLVFVNGHFSRELSFLDSLPNGLLVSSLSEALGSNVKTLEQHVGAYVDRERHPFSALNTALFTDGALIEIRSDAVIENPIHVIFHSTAAAPIASHPRLLIIADANSQATIIESWIGNGTYFSNAVVEVSAGENAVVDHYKVNQESGEAFHVAAMAVRLERNSRFITYNITLGGRLVRNDVEAWMGGEGAEATLNGLYLTSGNQHVDNHTRIDHAVPNCPSHELYKGILDGKSTGVFNGKIFVHKDAQKTDAKQTNQNLLLSRDATINTKPQLEIFADDVRCTHGATIGRLDEDALFYLRARGIGKDEARALLTFAFASDILGRIRVEKLRERLEQVVFALQVHEGDPHGPAVEE